MKYESSFHISRLFIPFRCGYHKNLSGSLLKQLPKVSWDRDTVLFALHFPRSENPVCMAYVCCCFLFRIWDNERELRFKA
eukprot:scaffold10472_cov126-Cylindrotheca_fusiformis.AAC.14